MSAAGLRVLKLGGSLLDYDELVPALRRWIARQPPLTNVIVPGGGQLADHVRDADRRHGLGPEASHVLAVRAMSQVARVLLRLFDESTLIVRLDELAKAGEGRLVIVDSEPMLRRAKAILGADRLPHNWDVTSDSIAARLAEVSGAWELVLLKSCWPTGCNTWQEAAERGYVDRYFPQAVANVARVRWINFRATDPRPDHIVVPVADCRYRDHRSRLYGA